MGKSIDFIEKRIKNDGTDLNIADIEKMQEFNFCDCLNSMLTKDIADRFTDNKLMFTLSGVDEKGSNGEKNIELIYDENADFEYFITKQCICDGTLMFLVDLFNGIFHDVLSGATYCSKTAPKDYINNIWKYNIKYTVGNFILFSDYGNFGTKEKPWLNEKFRVMLPIKCEYK